MRRMATGAPARATLIDFFDDATTRTGPFLVHDDGYRTRTFRYDEVGAAARRLAGRLHAAGLTKGDAVVLWGENRPEWIVAFWACLLRGIVGFLIAYFATFAVGAVLVAVIENDLTIGITGSITTLGNAGPGFGPVIGPMGTYANLHPLTKLIFIAEMWVGRLEVMTVLVLFHPDALRALFVRAGNTNPLEA